MSKWTMLARNNYLILGRGFKLQGFCLIVHIVNSYKFCVEAEFTSWIFVLLRDTATKWLAYITWFTFCRIKIIQINWLCAFSHLFLAPNRNQDEDVPDESDDKCNAVDGKGEKELGDGKVGKVRFGNRVLVIIIVIVKRRIPV